MTNSTNNKVPSEPININSESFEEEVLKSDLPVLVDFWASWCMPCRMMAPVLEEMAKKFAGKLKIVKINTEETQGNQVLAMRYNIQSIPNMKVFYKGELIHEFVGFRPPEMMEQELEKEVFPKIESES